MKYCLTHDYSGGGKTDRLTLLTGRFLISLKLKGIIHELN